SRVVPSGLPLGDRRGLALRGDPRRGGGAATRGTEPALCVRPIPGSHVASSGCIRRGNRRLLLAAGFPLVEQPYARRVVGTNRPTVGGKAAACSLSCRAYGFR